MKFDDTKILISDDSILARKQLKDILSREFDTLKCKKVPQSLEIGLFFCQIFIFII